VISYIYSECWTLPSGTRTYFFNQ